MDTNTIPPQTLSAPAWLEWIAEQPSTIDAIDTAHQAGAADVIVGWAVGRWEAEHHKDTLANRIDRIFARHGL